MLIFFLVTNTVDPAATVAVNPDNTVNPADTLMPDVPSGTDSSAANPIGPLGVVTHGPITPAVPTVPNVIPVRCASTTSWKGTSAQFDPEIVWHLIAFGLLLIRSQSLILLILKSL